MMETTTNVETGDGETESMHTNELSNLQENFNQQQVSVCVCVVLVQSPVSMTQFLEPLITEEKNTCLFFFGIF